MTEYSHELKIPKERVAVLIGSDGATKKELEEIGNIELDIDSKEGDIVLSGEDPLAVFTARDVIKAIGRGINPETAKQLFKQDYCLEIVNIMDFAKTKKDSFRLKGRVIGSEGKSRKHIESMCDVSISVYGKTISLIGEAQSVNVARRAIESLLSGSPHSNVYKWLEKQRRELQKMAIIGTQLVKEDIREEFREDGTNDTERGEDEGENTATD